MGNTELDFIGTDSGSLYYKKQGTGSRAILLFHGFGQSHEVFQRLAESLSDRFTCYAFDLFFHGDSRTNLEVIEKADWKKFIAAFLVKNNINKFSLLGFSIGAKFAIASVEAFADSVEELILLAPDGIRRNFWYTLATAPSITRKFFKGMVTRPGRFNRIATMAHRLRLIDKGMMKFAGSQMSSEVKRGRVYNSWAGFRHLNVDAQKLAWLLNQHSIKLILLAGTNDRVIRPSDMKAFASQVSLVHFEIIDAGHHDLIAKSIPAIKKSLVSSF